MQELFKIAKIAIPSRSYLRTRRAVKMDELDLDLDDWDGWLGKDERGYYSYSERFVFGSLEPQQGAKVYLDDHYARLEGRIIDLYREAAELTASLVDRRRGMLGVLIDLAKIESEIMLLEYYHSTPPSRQVVFTADELDEVVRLERAEYFVESLKEGSKPSPFGILTALRKAIGGEDAELLATANLFADQHVAMCQ